MAAGSLGEEGRADLGVVAAGDGASGVHYKRAGMSVEERQQMLDLREEVSVTTGRGVCVLDILHGRNRVTINPRIPRLPAAGVLNIMHGLSRMTIEPRVPTMPGGGILKSCMAVVA